MAADDEVNTTPPDFIPEDQVSSLGITPIQHTGPSSPTPPGFIPEDEFVSWDEQYGGLGGAATAAALGTARGLTGSLSDVLLTQSKYMKPEEIKAYKESHPTVSGGSEIASTLLGTIGTGGIATVPKLLTKIGMLAEKKAIEKGVSLSTAKAIGYAAEGSLYGVTESISEAALGDHDLVSEKTLSNIGFSAVTSGVLGKIVGRINERAIANQALKDLASTAEEKIAVQTLANNVDDPAILAILESGLTDKTKKKIVDISESALNKKKHYNDIELAGQVLDVPVMPGQLSKNKTIQQMDSALTHSQSYTGKYYAEMYDRGFQKIDDTIQNILGASPEKLSRYDAGARIKTQVMDTIEGAYSKFKTYFASRSDAEGVLSLGNKQKKEIYNNLIEQSKKVGAIGSPASKVIRGYAERAIQQNTVGQLDELVKEINVARRVAYQSGDTLVGKALGEVAENINDFQTIEMIKHGRKLTKEGAPEVKKAVQDLVTEHKAMKKEYGVFKEIMNDLVSDTKLGGRKDVTVGALENVLDGIPNEKLLDKMFVAKNFDGLKRLQSNFPEVFKTIVDQKKHHILQDAMTDGRIDIKKVIKQLYDDSKMTPEVRKLVFTQDELNKLNLSKVWVESVPKNINPSGTARTLEYLKQYRDMSMIGLGFQGLRELRDFALGKVLKHASVKEASKVGSLATLEKGVDKTTSTIKKEVREIISDRYRPPAAKISALISSPDEYKEKTEEIRLNANDMNYMFDNVSKTTEDLYEHAPLISQSIQSTIIRGMQFLSSKIPEDTSMGFFSEQKEPSQTEISKFNRYYTIIENPLTALNQVKEGVFTDEAKEALISVYPRLYDDMKQHLTMGIINDKKKTRVPYHVKISIARFLGQPIEESMLPQQIASFQRQFASVNQQQQAQQQMATKPSKVGMREITKSDRLDLDRYGKG